MRQLSMIETVLGKERNWEIQEVSATRVKRSFGSYAAVAKGRRATGHG